MELPYKIYITEDDILQKGYSLSKRLKIDDQGHIEATINAFLDEVALSIYNLLLEKINPIFDVDIICTCDEAKDDLTFCQLQQAIYLFENGNLLANSGYGNNNQLVDINQLRGNRAYSPVVINFLTKKGYFFGGIE